MENLTGSEKQINWANSIRSTILAKWDAVKVADESGAKNKESVRNWLVSKTSSSWWIDRQSKTMLRLAQEAAAELGIK
jgi:hypothetical protein